jgi:methyl-accepting chemotaxis protein/methyl-accepting chemotaxis protein-1 (serine sensor receptor)
MEAYTSSARAGEAGMGFAAVADEVRNLAQRPAQAAKDTAGLIEESISRSTEGAGKLEQVWSAIRNLTEGARKAGTLVDEVKAGSEEQARH